MCSVQCAVCSVQCAVSCINCTTYADSDRVMTWITLELEGVGAEEEGGQEGRPAGGWRVPGRAALSPIAGQLGERRGLLLLQLEGEEQEERLFGEEAAPQPEGR